MSPASKSPSTPCSSDTLASLRGPENRASFSSGRATQLVEFGHKARRAQPFALHEVAIGMREAALRRLTQACVIVEDFGQVWLSPAQGFAVLDNPSMPIVGEG